MGAEIEAAEAVIRLSGAGFTEVVRIAGPGTLWLTKNAVLATVYGLAKGGSARQIVRDPSGMNITPIPTEEYENVKEALKSYKIKFFSRQVDDTYTDICLKNSDTASFYHILENLGISAVKADKISIKTGDDKSTENIILDKKFLDEKEFLEKKKQDIGSALNRNTMRDFERDEAYYFADIENPTNFLKVTTQKVEKAKGIVYTISNYACYNNKTFSGEFSDKPVYGSPYNWKNVKENILKKSGITDGNFVYFENEEKLKEYQKLYNSHIKNSQSSKEINIDLTKLKEKMLDDDAENIFKEELFKELDKAFGKDGEFVEKVPAESPVLEKTSKGLKTGQKTINEEKISKNGGLKDFATQYEKNKKYPIELSKEDKQRLDNFRSNFVKGVDEKINLPKAKE